MEMVVLVGGYCQSSSRDNQIIINDTFLKINWKFLAHQKHKFVRLFIFASTGGGFLSYLPAMARRSSFCLQYLSLQFLFAILKSPVLVAILKSPIQSIFLCIADQQEQNFSINPRTYISKNVFFKQTHRRFYKWK